jgi:hypothetical protein
MHIFYGFNQSLALILILVINIIVIVQEHHLLLLIIAVVPIRVLAAIPPVLVVDAVFLQLLQLIRVRGADELPVHVEDLTLWVHEELAVITLDLDPPHDHVVF